MEYTSYLGALAFAFALIAMGQVARLRQEVEALKEEMQRLKSG